MSNEKEFILKRGVLLQPVFGGKYYTSLTITDDVARAHLRRHPEDKHLFEKVGSLDEPVQVIETPTVEPATVEPTVVEATTMEEVTPVEAPVKKTTKRKAKK